ncbi:Homeobox Protein Cut-Like 2 [Manis pentadactyla]|nr:Homeobox Protein Cut-Like 2 [Manis pentadactyla]
MILSLKKNLKTDTLLSWVFVYGYIHQKNLSGISILMLFSLQKQSVNWKQTRFSAF